MNVLERIFEERRAAAREAKRACPERELIERARQWGERRSLVAALAASPPGIVAEVKKASPSAGILCPTYDPSGTARAYVRGGACAISALTEPLHFLGSCADLEAVRRAVPVPVLRKDFMVDPYQVAEAAAYGADAILLIAAGLDDAALRRLHTRARELGLETLVEAHTEAELDRALALDGALIGVNSRDLTTLETNLAVAERLAARIPRDRVSIAESGISTREQVARLRGLGYRGFLIGESLLRSGNPEDAVARLAGRA